MENTDEVKNLITEAKNICVITNENEPECLTAALALFYTLKELNKNVNLVTDNFPEKLNFLVPSFDFISVPKNFVISIPRKIADVSQVCYKKNEEDLEIYLTLDSGKIRKENISLYFQEPKPELVITLGIENFKKQLESKLDSFGFLLESPILNIDNKPSNIKFGKINLVEPKSISEIILEMIKLIGAANPPLGGISPVENDIDKNLVNKNVANCILSGLMIYYENFQRQKMNPEIFETVADLIKMGANHQQIAENLNKMNEEETNFLAKIFENLKNESGTYSAILNSNRFENFAEAEADSTIKKLKIIGIQNDLLVLWQSHASEPIIKGFFYSKKPYLLTKISGNANKNDWVFLKIIGENILEAKEQIIKSLQ